MDFALCFRTALYWAERERERFIWRQWSQTNWCDTLPYFLPFCQNPDGDDDCYNDCYDGGDDSYDDDQINLCETLPAVRKLFGGMFVVWGGCKDFKLTIFSQITYFYLYIHSYFFVYRNCIHTCICVFRPSVWGPVNFPLVKAASSGLTGTVKSLWQPSVTRAACQNCERARFYAC